VTIKTIEKTATIDAPPERVWEVLTDDASYRTWTAEFMEGSYAETDWAEGSPVRFLDGSGSGLLAHVAESRPGELLDVEFDGLVADGQEDTTSEQAVAFRGAHETYWLEASGAGTHLRVASDMEEAYYDDMATAWDRALVRIQELATAR